MYDFRDEMKTWAARVREATIDAVGNIGMAAIDAFEHALGLTPVKAVEIELYTADERDYDLIADRSAEEGDVICVYDGKSLRFGLFASEAEVWTYGTFEDRGIPIVEMGTIEQFAGDMNAVVVLDLNEAAFLSADLQPAEVNAVRPHTGAVTVARARAHKHAAMYYQFYGSNVHFPLWCALGESADVLADVFTERLDSSS